MRTNAFRYELRIYWSAEDAAFIVEVPDLPGCMAHGATPVEAAANAQDAIWLWVDTGKAHGDPIPEPRRRTAWRYRHKPLVGRTSV